VRPVSERACVICGTSLAGKKANAATCSARCRQALRRTKRSELVKLVDKLPRRRRDASIDEDLLEPPDEAWYESGTGPPW
jgi:predicted nucleic acid-binding Zn ribbon protein